jgi:cytochrome c-type biogenesis protein CcsB
MEPVLLAIATLCYCSGTIGYLIYLVRERDGIHWASWTVLLVGSVVHGAAIVESSFQSGHLAVANSQQALSFFAWIIVVAFLIMQGKLRIRVMGSFVAPLAVLFMVLSSLLPTGIVPKTGIFNSTWFIIHVASVFLANALFALAFSAGIMYLIQERHIKRKSFGNLYMRLPSLDRLDQINYICLIAGFPLLTVGLITGFAYASTIWASPWNWDPKEISALVTWLIYAVLLHERLAVGWRGRRAAWLAIFGFSAILVTFLGVNLFMKGHHTALVR